MTAVENYLDEQTNGSLLGYFAGWSLIGGSTSKEKVHQVLMDLGLEDDFQLQKVGPTQGYRRAVLKATTGKKRDEFDYNVVKLREDEKTIIHAIVRQDILRGSAAVTKSRGEAVLTGDIDFDIEFRTGFDKEGRDANKPTKDLLFVENEQHPIGQRIKALYNELSAVYTCHDIRAAFQAAFESWHGFSTLAHGGMWFLPSCYREKAIAWREALRSLGHQPILIPIFDSGAGVADLQKLAASSVEVAVKFLKEELEGFVNKDSKTRLSTVEKRMEKFQDLKARTELYKEVLGLEIQELQEKIEGAQSAMIDFMSDLDD